MGQHLNNKHLVYIIDEGFAKQNARLQEKRALYEAQWKKSGSELSFKDWYIENAT